jgi:hypothetical protein
MDTREDEHEVVVEKKKIRKKRKKNRKSSRSLEKEPSVEPPVEPSLAGDTEPSSPEDDPILDDRERENGELDKKVEDIDLIKGEERVGGIDLIKIDQEGLPGQDRDNKKKTSQSVLLSPETEASPLNRDEKSKTSKLKSLGRPVPVPEGDAAHEVKLLEGARKPVNEVFHYAPITPDLTSARGEEGRNDSPRRASRPSKSKPIEAELDLYPSRSMQAQPEEKPSFGSTMVCPEESVPGEVKVSRKPIVTRRPIKDVEKDKRRKRMPVDPDEEKSTRSRVSRSRSRSRGRLRPEERREAEDDAGPIGGEGTPDDPIEISRPRSPSVRGPSRTYDESEIPTVSERKNVSNDRKSRERGKATSSMNNREKDMMNPVVDNEESLIRMLKESKKIDKDYRRRKLDRKEALHRIRAIKARLASADP